jgi:predicted O-methyltransferase YrrM
VVTCEIDNEAADIAREYFTKQQQQQQSSSSSSSLSECSNSNSNGNINSKNATTIELIRGPAMETLRQLQADINNRTSEPFDFVFLDADKRCYIRYYEYLMSNSILKVGGVILADNVLFKGLVINNVSSNNDDDDTTKCIEVETTNITTKKEIETSSPPPKQKLNYWKRRHQDIANTVHEFNTYVNADCRSSVVLLPLRDGLSIIRKKK